jgi:tetratricopeptide (TPR) repeat protein
MERALADASTAADRAFTRYYLAELSFDEGDAAGSLGEITNGLREDPTLTALYEGRAKAEAALGDMDAAIRDYRRAVKQMSEPSYVLEFGELLESVGRMDEAREQYESFAAAQRRFQASGVALDEHAVRFEADHGDRAQALTIAEAGIRTRPFLEMQDALAWALHVNGRDREALERSAQARALGTRNALWAFHAGMIEQSLGMSDAAIRDLREALTINPHFHPLHSRTARQTLAELRG